MTRTRTLATIEVRSTSTVVRIVIIVERYIRIRFLILRIWNLNRRYRRGPRRLVSNIATSLSLLRYVIDLKLSPSTRLSTLYYYVVLKTISLEY